VNILVKKADNLQIKRSEVMDIPIWIYAILAGIIISAFMALKTGREERDLELENIEREGEVYIKRMEEEKEQRDVQKELSAE
jgi:Na+/glutamate symporter